MSTRSEIGVELDDNSVISIYCHSDGYLAHNGALLDNYYNSSEKAINLVQQNDCSYLWKTIEESRFYNTWRNENTKYKTFKDREAYANEFKNHTFIEYCYLFSNKGFWCVLDDLSNPSINGITEYNYPKFAPIGWINLEKKIQEKLAQGIA